MIDALMRLNQVTIGAADLARSERFYVALGLTLIVRDDHYLRFKRPDGGSTFSVDGAAALVLCGEERARSADSSRSPVTVAASVVVSGSAQSNLPPAQVRAANQAYEANLSTPPLNSREATAQGSEARPM